MTSSTDWFCVYRWYCPSASANIRHQPGKTISAPANNNVIVSPKPYANLLRACQLLSVHTSSHATKGHASCGFIVASANSTPPEKRNPLTTQAIDPASNAA